jgi:hypothetical protein
VVRQDCAADCVLAREKSKRKEVNLNNQFDSVRRNKWDLEH